MTVAGERARLAVTRGGDGAVAFAHAVVRRCARSSPTLGGYTRFIGTKYASDRNLDATRAAPTKNVLSHSAAYRPHSWIVSVAFVKGPEGLGRWVPGLAMLRRRRDTGLQRDVVAGVLLAALLVPQGMAYAELAGVPPVNGLYATLVPLVVYFLLGPSRILVLGPDSAVSPLVAAAIIPLAPAGEPRIALAGLLAIVVGAIMLAGGLMRFGFVTELLSMPVRLGYLMGIAVTVIVAQLPKLFGFSVHAENLIPGVRGFIAGLDQTNVTALVIGVGSLALILALRRLAPKVPGVFLAVAGATLVVAVFGLAGELPVVGTIPRGLPTFGVPDVSFEQLKTLVPAAIGVAFVAFTDTSVLSRSYAGRLRQDVDQNQELAVLGVANIATGFFQGFPISTSSSRTAVVEDVGARSQVVGLAGPRFWRYCW